MRALVSLALAVGIGLAGNAPMDDEDKGKELKFDVYSGYFEKNNSGLKGDQSFLAIIGRKAFDPIFGVARVIGKKPDLVPEGAFKDRLVIATIKRGGETWTYQVDKVTLDDKGTLMVRYQATSKDGGGAKFASPLILSVPKGEYKRILFVENGKEVGKAEMDAKK